MKWLWYYLLDLIIARWYKPGQQVWGNCYLCLLLYWRYENSQLIITRSSSHDLISHIAWTCKLPRDLEVVHLQPVKRRYGWRALLHSIVYKGEWRRGPLFKKKDGDR